MAVRTDVTVNFDLSPRIITVAAPSVELTIQDLHDTLRDAEADLLNMDDNKLINSSGKETLGGGTFVGITSELQNAQVEFEERITPVESGTATTANAAGTTLIDSAATFVTNNIVRNSIIYNVADGSTAEVLTVVSETELTHTALTGGSENDWDVGEAYRVYNIIQCNITGGNLVAVDSVGADLDPVKPTFGTQVVRTSSSSATLKEEQTIENLKFLVEDEKTHSAFGNAFYWNPLIGDDSLDGKSEQNAVKTFAQAQTLVVAGNSDVIFVINTDPTGFLTITETLTITKANLLLRGGGRNIQFKPTVTNVDTIVVNASDVELSGFDVTTAETGTRDAVVLNFTRANVRRMFIVDSQGNGIKMTGADDSVVEDVFVLNPAQNCILIEDTTFPLIRAAHLMAATLSGIRITATGAADSRHVRVQNSFIHDNDDWQIAIGANVTQTIIEWSVQVRPDGLGRVQNMGTQTEEIDVSWDINDQIVKTSSIVEGTLTYTQVQRILLAAAAGKSSGHDADTPKYRDQADGKDRISATTSSDGRLTIVLDVS